MPKVYLKFSEFAIVKVKILIEENYKVNEKLE